MGNDKDSALLALIVSHPCLQKVNDLHVCVCPDSSAACGPVWNSSIHQSTVAWGMTTWFTFTLRKKSALRNSYPSSPHTSSFLPISTSPHVSATPCLSALSFVSYSTALFPTWFLSFTRDSGLRLLRHCLRMHVFVCQGCSCQVWGLSSHWNIAHCCKNAPS